MKKVFITALDLLSDPDYVNRTVVWLVSVLRLFISGMGLFCVKN